MGHTRSSRTRGSSAGNSWFPVTAVMVCIIGAAACTIFMINGNLDVKGWLSALQGGDKKQAAEGEEEAGVASLESVPDEKVSSDDPFAESSAGTDPKMAEEGENPFAEAESNKPGKKLGVKKPLQRVAQREEEEVPAIDWEEGAEKPKKKIPARPVSAKRERAGIADLNEFDGPAETRKVTDGEPAEERAPEPHKHKHLEKSAEEVEGQSDETPVELKDDKVSRRHHEPHNDPNGMYGQLAPPPGIKIKNNATADPLSPDEPRQYAESPPAQGLKHKHHHTSGDEPAEASDDPFANVRQVKDERVAAKPENDPALDSAELETATVTAPDTDIDLAKTRKLVADGDEKGAHRLLSEWYWKYPTQRKVLQKDLDELAKRIYFSPQPYFSEPYEVQSGDQLARIAKQYHVSWQYLAKLNQVQPKKLRVGRKLKVFEGPFQACVDLSDFELTIHQNGLFIKKYKVGIGKENSSPIGEFAVREKLENPTYYGPDGDVKEANDPLNPLGERWIDIGNSFGIHGTIEPDTVGKSASKGCIRMLNSDIEEVYDLLTTGSMVRIQR
ncbi:MAG: L,D-transpeptidase family protein [Planctomycetales bacterium]